jgi:hypothetical protein
LRYVREGEGKLKNCREGGALGMIINANSRNAGDHQHDLSKTGNEDDEPDQKYEKGTARVTSELSRRRVAMAPQSRTHIFQQLSREGKAIGAGKRDSTVT